MTSSLGSLFEAMYHRFQVLCFCNLQVHVVRTLRAGSRGFLPGALCRQLNSKQSMLLSAGVSERWVAQCVLLSVSLSFIVCASLGSSVVALPGVLLRIVFASEVCGISSASSSQSLSPEVSTKSSAPAADKRELELDHGFLLPLRHSRVALSHLHPLSEDAFPCLLDFVVSRRSQRLIWEELRNLSHIASGSSVFVFVCASRNPDFKQSISASQFSRPALWGSALCYKSQSTHMMTGMWSERKLDFCCGHRACHINCQGMDASAVFK